MCFFYINTRVRLYIYTHLCHCRANFYLIYGFNNGELYLCNILYRRHRTDTVIEIAKGNIFLGERNAHAHVS